MITVEKAIQIISQNIKQSSCFEEVNVSEARNQVLFEDIKSPMDMPPFRQSAMDGYALNLHDIKQYELRGEIQAGDEAHPVLKKGEAFRIFTGAPVPDSANAIIMQEKTSQMNSGVLVHSQPLKSHNIREIGEQIKKGQIALAQGTKLNTASIAFLTTLGIIKVKVYKQPKIAIVVTGNELIEAGHPLQRGQIYESNAVMLINSLEELGFKNISKYKVVDDYNKTLTLLKRVISENNVVLISGGISVGDYDYVGKTLVEMNVKQLFYKVKQKPGKPLFFGMKKDTLVFALPGNPAASLTCFYIYVRYALELLLGNLNYSVSKTMALTTSNFIKKGDRAQFLKAVYKNGCVKILDGQSSSMLHTFAMSNALCYISEKGTSIKSGDLVETILLPTS